MDAAFRVGTLRRMIRTLIVDDEPLAREFLAQMLCEHEGVELIGESSSGTAAVRDIRRLRPDLVLLDVQMPGMDGFAVLGQLAADELPQVIFVTAFDAYALKAFEVHAVDYLLKPFDEQRLAAALSRVQARSTRDDATTDRLVQLLEELNRKRRYPERLAVKSGDRTVLLPVRTIDLVEADGKFLRITAGSAKHVIRETLYQFGAMLDPQQFVRISRSVIVNVASIREILPWSRGEYLLVMKNGERVGSTRSFRDGLRQVLQIDDE